MIERKTSHLTQFRLLDYLGAMARYQQIAKHIGDGCTLLDVGCGYNANLLRYFSNKIKQGVGIDVSTNSSVANEKLSLVNWDLDFIEFPKLQNFDIVTCLAVVEHVKNPLRLLQFIRCSLKNSGYMLLTAPSWKAKPILEFMAFKLKICSEEEILDHKRYFSRDEIISLCEEAGFSKVKHRFFQFGWNNFVVAR